MQQNQPPTEGSYTEQASFTPLQWLLRRKRDVTVTSLGELFLPFFLAAMEACWFNAILIGLAGLDFLHSNSALLPFWGPPLLLFAATWLFRRALQKEAAAGGAGENEQSMLAIPGLRLMFGVLALLTVVMIWLHVYSATYSLFDPGWLLAFVNDVLAFTFSFYQALILVVISGYFCWRGIKLAQLIIEPGHVFRQIWAGLLVLLVAILLRAGSGRAGGSADDVVLVLLVPIFLYIALSTHALARITFIRREHPVGLEGSVIAQERAMLSVITAVGLVLVVVTILSSTFFSPSFFTSIQPLWRLVGSLYDLLVRGFAQLAVWIVTPFFGLFNLLFRRGVAVIKQPRSPVSSSGPRHPLPPISSTVPGLVLASKILVPVLILLILGTILYLTLRRRKRMRVDLARKSGDVHESVWSWQLFWSQVAALFLSLFRRIFPERVLTGEGQVRSAEELALPRGARTMREIYRALLKRAAARGHVRKRDETPHEFRQRLDAHEPQNEPQLGLLTEAYALTRYGGTVPSEHELESLRRFWSELEQKWEASR